MNEGRWVSVDVASQRMCFVEVLSLFELRVTSLVTCDIMFGLEMRGESCPMEGCIPTVSTLSPELAVHMNLFKVLEHVLCVGKKGLLCSDRQLVRRSTTTVDHWAALILYEINVIANMLTS